MNTTKNKTARRAPTMLRLRSVERRLRRAGVTANSVLAIAHDYDNALRVRASVETRIRTLKGALRRALR